MRLDSIPTRHYFLSLQKVFPEAASLANVSKQVGAAEEGMMNEDRFSAEDARKGQILMSHISSPCLSILILIKKIYVPSNNANAGDDLGLPSEDSEDDDFDPAGPDSSEDQKYELNSEESDFTSDSDDFCAEIAKSCGQDEVSVSPLLDVINSTDRMKTRAVRNQSNEEISNHALIDMDLEQGTVLPISSRRQVERLDYKKLYNVCHLSRIFRLPSVHVFCIQYFLHLVFAPNPQTLRNGNIVIITIEE
jgi:remodeling and spacing factor 1